MPALGTRLNEGKGGFVGAANLMPIGIIFYFRQDCEPCSRPKRGTANQFLLPSPQSPVCSRPGNYRVLPQSFGDFISTVAIQVAGVRKEFILGRPQL